jgi:hypothetical protein
VNIYVTIDVEVWCESWSDIDHSFPEAFRRYIYSGLVKNIAILRDFDIKASFFIEPLFSLRLGLEPLVEIVGLIKEAGQEIQLHLHPEWADEARPSIFPKGTPKRRYLRQFSADEQIALLGVGLQQLYAAGADGVMALRAGGYGGNLDTLRAASFHGLSVDTSYNPTIGWNEFGLASACRLFQPVLIEGVYEYPVSCFEDWPGHFRHAQIGACTVGELAGVLDQAEKSGWNSFVIVSHNFELMNRTQTRRDPIVEKRFISFCRFLSRNRERFLPSGFVGGEFQACSQQPVPLRSPTWRTISRMMVQSFRSIYR